MGYTPDAMNMPQGYPNNSNWPGCWQQQRHMPSLQFQVGPAVSSTALHQAEIGCWSCPTAQHAALLSKSDFWPRTYMSCADLSCSSMQLHRLALQRLAVLG